MVKNITLHNKNYSPEKKSLIHPLGWLFDSIVPQ